MSTFSNCCATLYLFHLCESKVSDPVGKMPKGIVHDGGLHSRKIVTGCSTWKQTNRPENLWTTELKDKFKTKEEALLLESREWDLPPQRGLQSERDDLRDASAEKFKKFAAKFGSGADLMKTLGLNVNDGVSLNDFSSKMKERNYDIYFTRDEQRLLFEKLTSNPSDGKVAGSRIVTVVSKTLDTSRKSDHKRNRILVSDIKHNISQQLFEKNRIVRLDNDTKSVARQLENALLMDPSICDGTVNTKNLKVALGPTLLDVKIPEEHISILLQDVQKKHGEFPTVGEFVRYMHMKESSMDVIPLHDARAANIARLKTKVSDIEKTCTDPALISRVEMLTQSLKGSRDLSGSKSLSTLRPRTSSNLGIMSQSQSQTQPDFLSTMGLSMPDTPSMRGVNSLSALSTSPPPIVSPMGKSASLFPPPDFSPTLAISKEKQSSTTKPKKKVQRQRDPVDVMEEEILLARTPRREGVRRVPVEPSDWSRVGVGGDGVNSSTGMFLDSQQQFTTDSMARFPSMKFAPGVGVYRECVGDAERLFLEREDRRSRRYERTVANLQVTQDRLELEDLEKNIKEMRRTQKSAMGLLQYNSSVFLKDIRDLRKQPLQSMQRKPNHKLFTKMWKGTFHPAHTLKPKETPRELTAAEKQAAAEEQTFEELMKDEGRRVTVAEDRDFSTVYGNSYKRDNTLLAKTGNRPSTSNPQGGFDPNFHRPGTSLY